MTIGAILAAYMSTINVKELAADVELLAGGLTDDEAVVLISHLLDDAIPEELFGAKADAAMEPLYADAASRIVALIHRRATGRVLKPHRVKGLMANERARVDALIAGGAQ